MAIVLGGKSGILGIHPGLTGVLIAYADDEWFRGLLLWHRWAKHGWVPHARPPAHPHYAPAAAEKIR